MPRVRPRQIWVGVAVAVAGMAVAMAALTFWRSGVALWVGLALVVVGLIVGAAAGMMHDVRLGRHGARDESSDLLDGGPHRGARESTAAARSPPPAAPATANAGADDGAHVPPAPAARRLRWTGIALALLGGWMVIAPLTLHYPDTEVTNDVIQREYAVAAVLVLSGLALRNPMRHPAIAAVPAVAGAALLLAVATAEPLTARATVHEALSGVAAIALAAGYAVQRLSS